jgi:hypothetical protein
LCGPAVERAAEPDQFEAAARLLQLFGARALRNAACTASRVLQRREPRQQRVVLEDQGGVGSIPFTFPFWSPIRTVPGLPGSGRRDIQERRLAAPHAATIATNSPRSTVRLTPCSTSRRARLCRTTCRCLPAR